MLNPPVSLVNLPDILILFAKKSTNCTKVNIFYYLLSRYNHKYRHSGSSEYPHIRGAFVKGGFVMPAGFWIAVGIQALVFVLMLIGRNKITEDD